MKATKKFAPKMDAFYSIMVWVESLLDRYLSSTQSRQMQLVLEEVIVNCIQHSQVKNDILLDLEFYQDQFIATIIDKGVPFNPKEYHYDLQKNKSIEERKLGGLGIFFVMELMDEVHYSRIDETNTLQLKKKIT